MTAPEHTNTDPLDEILERLQLYAKDHPMELTGGDRNDKETAKQAINNYINSRVEAKMKVAARNLQAKIARYGDGEIAYHNQEAVVPISEVLAELNQVKGEQ